MKHLLSCLSATYWTVRHAHRLPCCLRHSCPQVVCGFDHTLVLAQDGSLFTFGDNSLCQLGRPSQLQVGGAAQCSTAAALVVVCVSADGAAAAACSTAQHTAQRW